MALVDEEERRRAERAHQVALFRYQLIPEAADPALSPAQREAMVREIAARTHTDPFGQPFKVARNTLDRWIRAWRIGGFDALLPPIRQVTPRTPEEVLDLAAALKRENPARTTAQVVRILTQHLGWGPSYRTVHRHFQRLELLTRPDGQPPEGFGRFEADRPNELWVGDALHGPKINGRKTWVSKPPSHPFRPARARHRAAAGLPDHELPDTLPTRSIRSSFTGVSAGRGVLSIVGAGGNRQPLPGCCAPRKARNRNHRAGRRRDLMRTSVYSPPALADVGSFAALTNGLALIEDDGWHGWVFD